MYVVMKTEDKKNQVLHLRNEGWSYSRISKQTNLSKTCVRSICRKRIVRKPMKRGPKPKINAAYKLRLKRQIHNLKNSGEKINCNKLINSCNIPVSRFTVARYLKQQSMIYKKVRRSLPLKPLDKIKRCDLAKKWLAENHLWERTIFSDEKWFSIDGPDDWRTYAKKSEVIYRPRHQKKGGGIMVWAMVLPNGLLSYKILNRDFKSNAYIDLLCQTVVPICKLNYGKNFWFQQDNSRIHTARIVQQWMSVAHFPLLSWPARSPDLNIMENIWKILEDIIYDRSPVMSLGDLMEEIRKAFLLINTSKRGTIINLYESFRSRLVKVIVNNGNEVNN